ncbi:MAG: DUF924 family protein [Gemmobacter sp.]
MSDPVAVLQYWLNTVGPVGWYKGGEDLDDDVRARWQDLWEAAEAGGLDHWTEGPVGSLAFIILTDQFPRNMFRDQARAFATDAAARAAARRALEAGWDMAVPEPERQFMYLPFEHSEDADDQALSVRLFTDRLPSQPDNILHARVHAEVIRRHGRFPTRNAALGRANTPEEDAYLAEGGYVALVRAMRDPAQDPPQD